MTAARPVGNGKQQVQWVTYLVYLLLGVIAVISVWQIDKISCLPKEYVAKEQYAIDQQRAERDRQEISAMINRRFDASRESLNKIETLLRDHVRDTAK